MTISSLNCFWAICYVFLSPSAPSSAEVLELGVICNGRLCQCAHRPCIFKSPNNCSSLHCSSSLDQWQKRGLCQKKLTQRRSWREMGMCTTKYDNIWLAHWISVVWFWCLFNSAETDTKLFLLCIAVWDCITIGSKTWWTQRHSWDGKKTHTSYH